MTLGFAARTQDNYAPRGYHDDGIIGAEAVDPKGIETFASPCESGAMSGSDRKRQKKLEKNRKKRELAKKDARKLEAKYQGASLLRLAANAPFGPCWVSAALDEPEDEVPPALITVLVTRRIRGQLLGLLALVDRTCLGVKNANLLALQSELELFDFVDQISERLGEFRACEPSEAQAVVFHAIDYAASLGFEPHPDFEASLFSPRPEALRETTLAHPARPFFASSPHDDIITIVAQLERVVGAGNYDLLNGFLGDWLEDEDEDEDGDEGDQDAIETSGEVVDEHS